MPVTLSRHPPGPRDRLILDLYAWARDHWPAVLVEIAKHDDDQEFALRCCGAIFRRRAESGVAWLWAVLDAQRDGVLELCEYITPKPMSLLCGLWPLHGHTRGAWVQWLKALDEADPAGYAPADAIFHAFHTDEVEEETKDGDEIESHPQKELFR